MKLTSKFISCPLSILDIILSDWHGISNSPAKNENVQKDIINSINDLLKYAPEPFLKNIEQTLKDFKSLSDKFE